MCDDFSCWFLIVFREEVDIAVSTVCAPNNNSNASSTGNVFYNIFRFCYFSVFLNRTNRLSMETQIKLCQAVGYIFSVLYCISLTTDSFIMFVSIDNVCTVLVQTCITCYSMFILRMLALTSMQEWTVYLYICITVTWRTCTQKLYTNTVMCVCSHNVLFQLWLKV